MTNACLPRTRLNLKATLKALDVEHRKEWQPGYWPEPPHFKPGVTWCNRAVSAACDALGVPLPPGLLANEIADYFTLGRGAEDGWLPVLASQVTSFSNLGFPVVGCLKAAGHGHVVMATSADDLADERIHTWQAGRKNHENRPVGFSWTPADIARVSWFVHD